MPYVKIEIAREGVTKEKKRALMKGVTDLVSNLLNKNPQLTFVVIQEYDPDDWSHAGEGVPVPRRGYDC
ncbi:MAG: 4-oxalocrotonate tautomerase [Mucilaginibacter sp.]|nr:4-oxalocrotonate tautomerase [Mucilaginibacter sp.]